MPKIRLNDAGELEQKTVISQILTTTNQNTKEYDAFVQNNLITQNDLDHAIKKQTKLPKNHNNCPNFLRGATHYDYAEKFIIKNSIEIKVDDNGTGTSRTLNLTKDHLKQFDKHSENKIGEGTFGTVYQTSKFVIKVQDRNFEMGDNVDGKDRCFAFNELVTLQNKKFLPSDKCGHSDLYVTHFYAPSNRKPSELQLYIVMEKCEVVLDDLVKKVHQRTRRKFPIIFLKSICHLFLTGEGEKHNDIKLNSAENFFFKFVSFFSIF